MSGPPTTRPGRPPGRVLAGFGRQRLVDGLVVAAVAMLGLKLLGLVGAAFGPASPPLDAGPPAFGRVIAHARTNYVPADVSVTGSIEPKKDEPPPASSAEKARPAAAEPPAASAAERAILQRLSERREELQDKARETAERERLIAESEKRLDARLGELKALQERSAAAAEKKAQAENEGIRNLVVMYEAMKPKDAARIFDRLPQAMLVAVVRAMNPRKMSEILAAMSPASAEKLTVALAGRPKDAAELAAASLPPGELPSIPAPPRR